MKSFQTLISAMLIMSSIFMGFQVDRWWEEKREHRIQMSYLNRLILDLENDSVKLKYREEYFSNVKQFGSKAVAYLNNPTNDPKQQAQILAAFYLASQAWDFTPSSTTFQELKSSGALSLIRDVDLRTTLAVYYQTLEESNYVWKAPNYYRRTIRSIIPPLTQKALWQQCHQLSEQGSRQVFVADCSPNLDLSETARTLEEIRESIRAKQDLYFMMSNVDISLILFRDHLSRTQNVVSQVVEARDAELSSVE